MLNYKSCSICGLVKEISDFSKKGAQCKLCLSEIRKLNYYNNKEKHSERSRKYREKNRDKIKARRKEYYEKNKEKILNQQRDYQRAHKKEISLNGKKYREENKEAILKQKKKYYEKNFERIQKYQKEYSSKNINKLNEYGRIYQQEKRKNDILFKLRRDFSRAIYGGLKKQASIKKHKSILDFLSYTMDELKNHLEALFEHSNNLTPDGKVWMNWNNWGVYKRKTFIESDTSTWVWHIDHIIPHSALPYTSMQDENFKKCWDLSNLRPLRADLNIIEGSTKIRHKGTT